MIKPVIIDFETVELLLDGGTKASVDAYKTNFRVTSMAAIWRNEVDDTFSKYFEGEPAIRAFLEWLVKTNKPVVCHNIQYERLVNKCRFNDLPINWYADTMRLAQLYDNGGDKNQFETIVDEEWTGELAETPIKRVPLSGLGLSVCNKRILAGSDHKSEAYTWIRANIPESAGSEGSFLDKLPADIMQRYNIADVQVTLDLYEFITGYFDKIGFDWALDNSLYMSTVGYLVNAKVHGAQVNREQLVINLAQIKQEIKEIESAFLVRFKSEIEAIEFERMRAFCNKPGVKGPPTAKRIEKRVESIMSKGLATLKLSFNTGSNKQLEELFAHTLRLVPKFFTKKGASSFRSVHLNQWGEGGSMLATRRKKMIIMAQMESLLKLSEYDGRWHPDLRAAGTVTGRFIGSR